MLIFVSGILSILCHWTNVTIVPLGLSRRWDVSEEVIGKVPTNIWVGITDPDSQSLGWDTATFSPVVVREVSLLGEPSSSYPGL